MALLGPGGSRLSFRDLLDPQKEHSPGGDGVSERRCPAPEELVSYGQTAADTVRYADFRPSKEDCGRKPLATGNDWRKPQRDLLNGTNLVGLEGQLLGGPVDAPVEVEHHEQRAPVVRDVHAHVQVRVRHELHVALVLLQDPTRP